MQREEVVGPVSGLDGGQEGTRVRPGMTREYPWRRTSGKETVRERGGP